MQDTDHDDSELETDFLDLRKRILSFQDTIAVLDAQLYSDSIYESVTHVFKEFLPGSLDAWQDMEVALFQLHSFADPLKRIYPFTCGSCKVPDYGRTALTYIDLLRCYRKQSILVN